LILAGLALWMVIPSATAAQPNAADFSASFSGTFQITGDVGNSGLFIVEESGSGSEQTLGAFSYETRLMHNLARRPPGCGPGSSTGTGGSASLTFADGVLRLERKSGAVCFAFPFINVEEEWVIASGTGAYAGVTGKFTRRLTGDVRFGTATGSIDGEVKL
jgi:hypothetical protein